MNKIKAWVESEDNVFDIMQPRFKVILTSPKLEFFAIRILETAMLNLLFSISAIFQIQGTVASQLHIFTLRGQDRSITDSLMLCKSSFPFNPFHIVDCTLYIDSVNISVLLAHAGIEDITEKIAEEWFLFI